MTDTHTASGKNIREALTVIPFKTLRYFAMYFLNLPDETLRGLSSEGLTDALMHSDKATAALDVYEEAQRYIAAYGHLYHFYRWDDAMPACEYVALEAIIEYLERTEYFGLAACAMLMECGEIALPHGMLYAIRKKKPDTDAILV